MKLLKCAVGLLNRQVGQEWCFCARNRLFSDKKADNSRSETAEKLKQIQPEKRDKQNNNVEKHFKGGVTITSYNTYGFRLNEQVQVIGPIIVFPQTVFSWHVESADRINTDSLILFSLIQPRIETLIIGTGEFETTSHISKSILEIAHKHKINIEILTTELACTQFNYLNAEGRMIAAAMIPPKEIRFGEDDMFATLNFDNKLFTIDSLHTPDIRKFVKDVNLKK